MSEWSVQVAVAVIWEVKAARTGASNFIEFLNHGLKSHELILLSVLTDEISFVILKKC